MVAWFYEKTGALPSQNSTPPGWQDKSVVAPLSADIF
jgi:hypothetical protein